MCCLCWSTFLQCYSLSLLYIFWYFFIYNISCDEYNSDTSHLLDSLSICQSFHQYTNPICNTPVCPNMLDIFVAIKRRGKDCACTICWHKSTKFLVLYILTCSIIAKFLVIKLLMQIDNAACILCYSAHWYFVLQLWSNKQN